MSSDIKALLTQLAFLPEDNAQEIYHKKYLEHKNYTIKIYLDKGEIDYGQKIILGDKTTCNFSASENFVILECVNRLLEKGYPPECIMLEKNYPLGHKTKGKLDILVTDKAGKAFLMIECKTWGTEYEKALKKTLNNGGQLFSYFQQDKSAKFLCLYTSGIVNNNIIYKNSIIKIEDDFLQTTNTREAFEKWNKNLKPNGIFEEDIKKYCIIPKALTLEDLKEINHEISSIIFNQFEEILRRHVISDKPNAFNKFIALIICKIIDEKKKKTEQLEFQWLEDDTLEKLQIRLSDLYRAGMKSYLDKTITDYNDKDIDDEFSHLDACVLGNIKKMFARMRLEKNNEFAFKEVFDNQSFLENAKVVKDMVQMFEEYKVRYNRKHDYLGAFFELLLNTSLKQEAGQFFTPVPVARFIINAIPLKEIILNNLKDRNNEDILPYAIDYACGSGHFITELMDQLQLIINEIAAGDYDQETESTLKSWAQGHYRWAEKYIYGIEKDYRLFKTAKVACFLNGDGLANIINADGLAAFNNKEGYKGKLSISNRNNSKDNQQFDILVSNPPYSVSAFRNTIEKSGASAFELYDKLTTQSSEIESLFIERSKQLLKEGGYAGIILPSSILSNSGIYTATREMLLKYFKIIAIVELGSNTFMATGTNTVILFLQRRSNYDFQRAETSVTIFFQTRKDNTANGVENLFSKYVTYAYKTLSFEDYISLINKKPSAKMQSHELFQQARKTFENSMRIKNLKKKSISLEKLDELFYIDLLNIEKEKLVFFILAYPQKTLLIKSSPDGKNETEKAFLGYEFSNRRGHEGIKPYGAKTIQEATKLYDENYLLNPEKINAHIYQAFLGEEIAIPETLQQHITQQNLVDMMQWDRVDFQKSISLAVKKKTINYIELWKNNNKLVSLDEIAIISKGTSITKNNTKNGNIPVIAAGKEPAYFHNIANRKGDIITISASGANAGFVNFFTQDIFASDCNTIQSKNEKAISTKLIYYYLSQAQEIIYGLQRGQAQPHVYANDLKIIKIPLPPKDVQEKIVKEIDLIEVKQKNIEPRITELNHQIDEYFQQTLLNAEQVKFNTIAALEYGASLPERNRKKGEFPVMGSNGIVGYHNEFLIKSPCIIIGRKGSAGKVTLIEKNTFPIDTTFYVKFDQNKIHYKFLYYLLLSLKLESLVAKMGVPGLNRNEVYNLNISLPSMKIQEKFILQLGKIESQITALKSQLENCAAEKSAVLKKYL